MPAPEDGRTDIPQRFRARKKPRQERSRFMLETIKQAARELITTEDFSSSNTSTTRIAAHAGISVGSLYQYFPTREAIFLALFEDATTQMIMTMQRVTADILDRPLDATVARVIRQILALHREHELVVLKMVTKMPELQLASHPLSYENMIHNSIRIFVAHHIPGIKSRELERRAFFLREIILGCIHRYLSDSPEVFGDKAFISDLARIVIHYIGMPKGT